MSYIVLQPHSSTNQTDEWQVVDMDHWLAFVNRERLDVPATGYATFQDAEQAARVANETAGEAQ